MRIREEIEDDKEVLRLEEERWKAERISWRE